MEATRTPWIPRREDMRPVRFTFDWEGDAWDGWTDDSHWNGWLNVWCEPATAQAIDEWFIKRGADPSEVDVRTLGVEDNGLVSLCNSYTTREVNQSNSR